MMAQAEVGPFSVMDATYDDVVGRITSAVLSSGTRQEPFVAYDLHVNGILHADDDEFVRAMNAADVVYADGISIVVLAKAGGARHVERAPTSDLGYSVVRSSAEQLGRAVRLALVGGEPGLATRAGQQLASRYSVDVVYAGDGFQQDWQACCADICRSRPDIIFVGMGAPLETLWVASNMDRLPAAVIMTCGGWFGFVAGDERRAPVLVQRMGLEWTWRLAQSPRRLANRYVKGSGAVAKLYIRSVRMRKRVGERQRTQRDVESPGRPDDRRIGDRAREETR
jgi:N-acetylglucosaminyldiphosphoundecaprenol N-acetyl-beta-D-mannosaminyltransferase